MLYHEERVSRRRRPDCAAARPRPANLAQQPSHPQSV